MADTATASISASDCEDEEDEDYCAVNSDSWDEEENSDSVESSGGGGPESLEQLDDRFRGLVDHKIRIAEKFCDHKHYVFSFVLPEVLTETEDDREQILEPNNMPETEDSADFHASPPPTTELTIDSARDEIVQLRLAREIFVSHKTEVKDRLKQTESDEDARWFYECEEVIEAIDTIIDYKNEVICGKESGPPQLFPEKENEEAKLIMSRLGNLSSAEQLRLFCKFFNKVVELRHSSKQLEKTSDQLLAENEDMFKCLKHYKRKIRKQEEAYSDHVKLLTINHSGSTGYNEDSRSHRHHTRDDHRPSSSHRHRQNHNGGLCDSVRDHQRHYPSGPEITRQTGKIRIHNQNSH